ncbi:hypothetical protein QFC21_006208 [Naganishia friedmannii]|uniref:Uncharacterized protein n=1 Tax=Naganishia friedmannii TaxID=89922 RepID=A0ACC2V496_9TREE|nr:hypothetical protein QFC21_006208 [Naganishia friedmannii]
MSLAPGETTSSTTYKARIIGDYILEHLASHKGGKDAAAPLMVAMHGPQGCGKTTLTNEIQRYLQDSQAKARSAVLSLDDLYHKHESLLSLCQSHPNNGLLAGRGLPGTHDLELARTTLDAVINCNQRAVTHIELPVFDKSVFGGEGDRSSSTISIETPIDVFILEGWSMGFQALAQDELCRKYEQARSSLARDPSSPAPTFLSYSLESVQRVNEYLLAASEILYPPFSLLVQICPESYAYVYAWRLQQEHQLIAARGTGMTDAQVGEFVRRYMPGYELWAEEGTAGEKAGSLWSGKSLVLRYGREREVVSVDNF